MTEEFNLSEKMFEDGEFSKEDVKEFIKKLKEEFCLFKEPINTLEIHNTIGKLAGEKLTSEEPTDVSSTIPAPKGFYPTGDNLNDAFEIKWGKYLRNHKLPNGAWIKELARSFFKREVEQCQEDTESIKKFENLRCCFKKCKYENESMLNMFKHMEKEHQLRVGKGIFQSKVGGGVK